MAGCDGPVTVLGEGLFAEALAGGIRSSGRDVELRPMPTSEILDGLIEPGGPVVVSPTRRDEDLLDRLDRLCQSLGRSWLPVIHRHPQLQIGPVLGAGGPCLRCVGQRMIQHERQDELGDRIERHGRFGGVTGLPPATAAVAAGLVLLLLDAPPAQPIGRPAFRIAAGGAPIERLTAVGQHGCPRCGHRPAEALRAAPPDALRSVLAEVRTGPAVAS